jgi:hypothetical protein
MICSRQVLTWLVAAAVSPTALGAQTPTRSFDDLRRVLKVGESVIVTNDSGQRTKGNVADVSGLSLTLQVRRTKDNPQGTRTFAEDTVIRVTRRDSLENGVLIGLGAGAVAAWGFVRGNCGPAGYDPECGASAARIGLLAFVPAGAVAGALIDKAIGNAPVYLSPSRLTRSSLAVLPWFGSSAGGVALSFRF